MSWIGIGGLVAAVCLLAARSYFGKKYGTGSCHSCQGCPRAAQCRKKK